LLNQPAACLSADSKQRLVEAFVYQPAIDPSTYQEQLDKLNEGTARAEINERDARIEETDVQAAISYGEFILLSAPRLWAQLSLEQKTATAASGLPTRGTIRGWRLSNH